MSDALLALDVDEKMDWLSDKCVCDYDSGMCRYCSIRHALADLRSLAERIPREPTEAMITAMLAADHRLDFATAVWQAGYDAAVPGIPRERDAEDAKRYRWLRNVGFYMDMPDSVKRCATPEEMDAAIDAAMGDSHGVSGKG